MSGWTLVEPCCGTAALTLHLLGARRQLVPRQGSKWNLRRDLEALGERLGFMGRPSRVVLSDAAPWALVVAAVLEDREALLEDLRPLVDEGGRDPRGLYARLHGGPVPTDQARLAAELLWLQRMAFAGRAVEVVGGRWHSHGLNLTSAFGVARTERFKEVRPLGPALLREVERAPRGVVEPSIGLARPKGPADRTLVYLDPPYAGTTGYGVSLSRDAVVDLALEWAEAGATVIVSEASAVAELETRGWATTQLADVGGLTPDQLFRARHRAEWVTWCRAPVQLDLWSAA